MNENFSRIITLLRKERGLSQKKVASDLNISQALLSHYEKGIRECGLDFVVKTAYYYNVSCDYLLGKSAERSGQTIKIDDIPNDENIEFENKYKGSLLPTLNKKLISNSLTIIFDLLEKYGNKNLTNEISLYLMVSIYKTFRMLYSANPKNPQSFFSIDSNLYNGFASALQNISNSNANNIIECKKRKEGMEFKKDNVMNLSPEIISKNYPKFSLSLYNLIQNTENKINKLK